LFGEKSSEAEYPSALVLKEDPTLAKLDSYSPDHNFNFADDTKGAQIEEMYD
jgi:hypothetical protein